MKRSVERILTTHAGSLPRPLDLVNMIVRELRGEDIDRENLEPRVKAAVKELVERQTDIGIDVVSDGEASKSGFSNYIINRYSGFGGDAVSAVPSDLVEFPDVRSGSRPPPTRDLAFSSNASAPSSSAVPTRSSATSTTCLQRSTAGIERMHS